MAITNHIFIDYETLGMPEDNCVALSVAAIHFTQEELEGLAVDDINVDRFKRNGIEIKFDVRDQVKNHGKRIDQQTAEWWKKQSPEARKVLKADPSRDVTLVEGIKLLFDWLPDVDMRNVAFWSRGNNFDLPLFKTHMTDVGIDKFIAFWNFRDVRSFVAGCMLDVDSDKVPLDVSQMEGFVAHDALSDCAKDVCMIFMAMRYAAGEELPLEPHKDTIPFSR